MHPLHHEFVEGSSLKPHTLPSFFRFLSPPTSHPSDSTFLPSSSNVKTFAQALKNAYDIPVSQLPIPGFKRDAVAVKIPEDEYKAGLKRCRNNLHGRLILVKGEQPIKASDLRTKLLS